jgi:hypothetical protein
LLTEQAPELRQRHRGEHQLEVEPQHI